MKNRNRLRRFLIYVGIAALATAAGWFGGTTSLGTQMELRTYDYRFQLKELFPSGSAAPITILAIDQNSLDKIPDPLMFWQRHFAVVLGQLGTAGAQAVGIDVLLSSIERFDPAGQKSMMRALLGAAAKDLPVILANVVRENGVDQPAPEFAMATANAVDESFGYANLTVDPDDFVRRQKLDGIGKNDGVLHPGLALAVARAFSRRTGKPLKFEIGRESVLIDYMPQGTFPRVSFSDALEAAGKGDVEFFKTRFAGRIVLIGRISERGGDDRHSTPLYYSAGSDMPEGPRMAGIDIHANTIAMLLDNRPIRELSAFQHLLIAGFMAVAFTFVWGYLRQFALASTLFLVVGYPIFVIVMFMQGQWIWTVVPFASSGAALILTLFANYFLEGKQKERMRRLFKGYVSEAVIAELMASQDGVVLSGERRRIAVLFADIKGFTTISETASPERVVQLLNEYFGVMVGIIHSHGGTVNSLMGDGIMAIFGAPVIDGDAALHAVFAGQEMMRALAGVNESLQAKNYDPIGIGVGINSGEAVIGNMGSTQKMEYTAIGDVVNTAARIEGQTRKLDADILISEDAYRWIDGRVEAAFIQDAELKGKGQTVRLYRVLWR